MRTLYLLFDKSDHYIEAITLDNLDGVPDDQWNPHGGAMALVEYEHDTSEITPQVAENYLRWLRGDVNAVQFDDMPRAWRNRFFAATFPFEAINDEGGA